MTSEQLLGDWLNLSESERQQLSRKEDDFSLSRMKVYVTFRRASTLAVHFVTDLVEPREVQSGSDGDVVSEELAKAIDRLLEAMEGRAVFMEKPLPSGL